MPILGMRVCVISLNNIRLLSLYRNGISGKHFINLFPLSPKYNIPIFNSHSFHTNNGDMSRHNMKSLENLNFDNLVLRSLPIDPSRENTPRQVHGACFSLVEPTPVKNPEIVAVSIPALKLLDLDEKEIKRADFVEYFSGNKKLTGSETAAHCYCGHQFGAFAGQLGDGAAIYLGEIVNGAGERWEIQLKGGGLTPYSRTADGRKVLRSSIREFLCSEAMYHLGIPTTRAGSCITSESTVIRDIHYSGNPILEKCTIVLRIAPTFIRFGSFQICKTPDRLTGREGPSVGRFDVLEKLTDYVIETHYPKIHAQFGSDKKGACTELLREVVLRTARLVAQWQCVGWCHGVLNTDNMSILGLTIDYGPYGFIDRFDPDFICNDSDNNGRYTYEKQPEVCKWNCEKLAQALSQLLYMDMTELYPILDIYDGEYERAYVTGMRKKFGLNKELETDSELVKVFMDNMEKTGADFTNSFRCLSILKLPGTPDHETSKTQVLDALMAQCCTLQELIKAHAPRMETRQLQMLIMMLETNPGLVAQLGAGQKVIYDEIRRMEKVKVLREQNAEQKTASDRALWSDWLETYTARLRLEVTDTVDVAIQDKARQQLMNSTNPRFILRNYIAQIAIDAAEKGDYSEVENVLRLLQDPYSDDISLNPVSVPDDVSSVSEATSSSHSVRTFGDRPPSWANQLRVT